MSLHYAQDIIEKIAVLRTSEALLISGLGKWLTGKPGAENVVLRNRFHIDSPNITIRNYVEVFLIQLAEMLLLLAGEYAGMAELRECEVKTAQSGKEIDKFHSSGVASNPRFARSKSYVAADLVNLRFVPKSVNSRLNRRKRRRVLKAPSFLGLIPTSPTASRVKGSVGRRDTTPETLLRRFLWRLGLRYRVDKADLIGRPDIVFVSARVAVFCDGDFWHGRNWPARRKRLRNGANASYWVAKIKANRARDRRQTAALESGGWLVIRLWEGEIKANPSKAAALVHRAVVRRSRRLR